jgi:hypothetical protein
MIKKVEIQLRPAEASDLKSDNMTLKQGVCFWLKSIKTGSFDNKHYIINQDTDPFELKYWLDQKMIYVPISDIWMEDYKNLIKN